VNPRIDSRVPVADFAFVTQAAEDTLNRWVVSKTIGGDTIASIVADGAT
jgi:serine protease inhibitor